MWISRGQKSEKGVRFCEKSGEDAEYRRMGLLMIDY